MGARGVLPRRRPDRWPTTRAEQVAWRVPADRAWRLPREGRTLAAIATRKVSPGRRSPAGVASGSRSRRATPPHDSAFWFSLRRCPAPGRLSRAPGESRLVADLTMLTMADSAERWRGASPPVAWRFPREGRTLAAIATPKVSPDRRSPSGFASGSRSRRTTPPGDSAFGFPRRHRPAPARRFSRTAGRPTPSPP